MATTIPPTSTAVVESKYPLVQVIQKREAQLAPFLPKGRTLESVAHEVQMCAIKNPDLLNAVPASLAVAVQRGLQANLHIGEEWHLLTFKNKELSAKYDRDLFDVVGTIDYKALAAMVISTGVVRWIDPQCVYEKDEFSYQLGLDKKLTHLPAVGNRGKMTGAYVVFRLPFGAAEFYYMPIADIDAIRTTKSQKWKNGACPDFYAKKTVIKQGVKLLPKDKRFAGIYKAIDADDEGEIVDATMEPAPANGAPANVDSDGVDLDYVPTDE